MRSDIQIHNGLCYISRLTCKNKPTFSIFLLQFVRQLIFRVQKYTYSALQKNPFFGIFLYLKYYFQRHVCPSVRAFVRVSEDQLQYLQANHKMSLIKVVPYVVGMTPGVPGAPEPRMYPRSGYFLVTYNCCLAF